MHDITLTIIVFVPAAAALLVLALPVQTDLQRFRVRTTALFASVISLAFALFDLLGEVGNPAQGALPQPAIDAPWLRGFFFQLDYHLGTDGLNMLLLFAVTAVFPLLILASWRRRERYRTYFALLLLIETTTAGAFATQDLGLFIVFFWAQALPLGLLVGLGGQPGAAALGRRLLGWQSISGAALLVGTLLLLLRSGVTSMNFQTLTTVSTVKGGVGLIVFTLFLVAFGLRMGLFPLHGWFIDSVGAAPAPVGMLVAVTSVPLGVYGLVRMALSMAPNAALQLVVPLLALALLTLYWAALRARGEPDLRRMGAYGLMGLSGVMLLGIASFSEVSEAGALYLAFTLVFIAPLLLLVLGAVSERAGALQIAPLRGAAARAPRLRLFFALAAAALVGVPLLGGFPGIFQVLVGSFPAHRYATALAVLGLLLLTAALWRAGHRVFWGAAEGQAEATVADARGSEFYSGWGLSAAVVLFGIFAGYFMPYVIQGTDLVSARVSAAAPVVVPHSPGTHK